MLQSARNKATMSILGRMREQGPPAVSTGIQQPPVPGQLINPTPQTNPLIGPDNGGTSNSPGDNSMQQQAGEAGLDMNASQPVAGTNPPPNPQNFFQNQATNPMLARKNKKLLGQ